MEVHGLATYHITDLVIVKAFLLADFAFSQWHKQLKQILMNFVSIRWKVQFTTKWCKIERIIRDHGFIYRPYKPQKVKNRFQNRNKPLDKDSTVL